MGKRGGCTDIMTKSVYQRNIFDFLKSGSFNQCQECGNDRQLQGMVYLCGCCEVSALHISYSVRLRVAHSTLVGKPEPQEVG